jgi:hypothetical protein
VDGIKRASGNTESAAQPLQRILRGETMMARSVLGLTLLAAVSTVPLFSQTGTTTHSISGFPRPSCLLHSASD